MASPVAILDPLDILIDRATVLTLIHTAADGSTPTISSGTVSIYDYTGTILETDQPCTKSTNILSYTIKATIADEIGVNYRAQFKYLISSVYHEYDFYFDVVRYLLPCPVNTAIVEAKYPQVKNQYPKNSTNWQAQINQAFQEVKSDLRNQYTEKWLNCMVDTGQIKELVLYRSGMVISAALITSWDTGNPLVEVYNQSVRDYREKLLSGKIYVDVDQDGIVDAVVNGPRTIQLVR